MKNIILSLVISSLLIAGCGEKREPVEEYFPESSPTDAQTASGASIFDTLEASAHRKTVQKPEIFVQMGHVSDGYTSNTVADFTPDGKYVVSGNKDGWVILWEIGTGREVKKFRCRGRVRDVRVSSDGKFAASSDGSYSHENINLWDMSTGKKVISFGLSGSNNNPVLFYNNNRTIIAGGEDASIKLWDIQSGNIIRELNAAATDAVHKPEVSAMALTPDEQFVVAAYQYNGREEIDGDLHDVRPTDPTISVWNVLTGEEVLRFNQGNGWVNALAVTPDGNCALSGHWRENSVRLWELETGTQIQSFDTGGTSAIAVSSGGRYALLGGCSQFILLELSTGKIIRRIDKDIDAWVESIKFSPDGKYALVGDKGFKPKLWDLATGELVREFGGYAGQTLTAQLSRTANVLMTAHGYCNSLDFWDYESGCLLNRVKTDNTCIMSSAAMYADGSIAVAGGWDMSAGTSNAVLWNPKNGDKILGIKLDEQIGSHTKSYAFVKNAKQLLWTSETSAYLADLETGNEIRRFSDIGRAEIIQLEIDAGERYFYIDDKLSIKLIDFVSGEIVKSFEECKGGFNQDKTRLYLLGQRQRSHGDKITMTIETVDMNSLKTRKAADIIYGGEISTGTGFNGPGNITHVAVGTNEDYLLISDRETIYKIDLKRKKIASAFVGHTDRITGMDISSDGKFVCSSSNDGTTRLWDIETGNEVAQFVSFSDGEWIVITPDGYFNASENGAKYLNVRVGHNVYSVDNFYEKYFNPVYIASVLQGKSVDAVADIRNGIAPPPEIQILSPPPNAVFDNPEITLTISARDMGGDIHEIRLYHNGKVVGQDSRGIGVKAQDEGVAASGAIGQKTQSYHLTLVEGANIFRATGFSKDRTESNPAEIVVKLAGGSKPVSLHLLTVGINRYKNPALNLNYAEPDAKGIGDFFRQNGEDLFKDVDIKDIYNEQATKAGILSRLKQLESTDPQDAVLIYLAGHGENIADKWYFIPHELTYPEREEDLKAKALSSDELSGLIRGIKAQKILVLIDACKSGAALVAFRGFEDRKALSQLSRATGVHVVAASTRNQYASEVKELGHGVFTYTLLEGLNGKAAATGESITVRRLLGYIEEQLPELTQRYRQEAQYPVVDSKGMDFPLVAGK